jgi:hypothetical protein
MKKTGKIILGIASLWPITYMVIFISIFIFTFLRIMSGSGAAVADQGGPPSWFILTFVLHLVTMLWTCALLVIYIIDVFKNERVNKDKKALWAVVLFFGNMIAMPIYWYLHIWREPKTPQTAS